MGAGNPSFQEPVPCLRNGMHVHCRSRPQGGSGPAGAYPTRSAASKDKKTPSLTFEATAIPPRLPAGGAARPQGAAVVPVSSTWHRCARRPLLLHSFYFFFPAAIDEPTRSPEEFFFRRFRRWELPNRFFQVSRLSCARLDEIRKTSRASVGPGSGRTHGGHGCHSTTWKSAGSRARSDWGPSIASRLPPPPPPPPACPQSPKKTVPR